MQVSQYHKYVFGFSALYVATAALLALADVVSTAYVLSMTEVAYEANLRVDESSIASLMLGSVKSLVVYSGLFLVSVAMSVANKKYRRILQISSRWDEMLIRLPGSASIVYLILAIGAVVNNVGAFLFESSWLQQMLGMFGFETVAEVQAGFILYSIASFVVLMPLGYYIFSKIAVKAGNALATAEL